MTEAQVKYLVNCLGAGLMVWFDGTSGWAEVVSIAESREHEKEEEREDWYVGYFKDGSYLALEACYKELFLVTTQNIAQWPKE